MDQRNPDIQYEIAVAKLEERRRCARIAAAHAKSYAASPTTLLCRWAAEDIEREILEGNDA